MREPHTEPTNDPVHFFAPQGSEGDEIRRQPLRWSLNFPFYKSMRYSHPPCMGLAPSRLTPQSPLKVYHFFQRFVRRLLDGYLRKTGKSQL